MTPIVIIVYWGLIFKKHKGELWEASKLLTNTEEKANIMYDMKIMHAYLTHILPAFCAFLLMLVNDTVLIRRHSNFLIGFGIFYGVNNYLVTKRRGYPLYWFMTWEDHWSVIYFLIIGFSFTAFFFLTVLLDESITGRKSH